MPEFYSQFGQDKAVRELFPITNLRELRDNACRFYVDVGAGDGRTDSNTLHFEESGWRGLCIEADHEVFEKLRTNRHAPAMNIACANREETLLFRRVPTPGWSGLVDYPHQMNAAAIDDMEEAGQCELLLVNCLPLQRILDEHKVSIIDYLSLDIEGAELSALESIDWERTTIYVITVEISRTDGEIGGFLTRRGYCLWGKLGSDELYVSKDWLLGGRR